MRQIWMDAISGQIVLSSNKDKLGVFKFITHDGGHYIYIGEL